MHVPQSQSNRDIEELPGPVDLGPETTAGDAVMKPGRHLFDPVTLSQDIDNQGGFHAPAPGQGLHRIEGRPGDAAHPRQRLSGPEPGEIHHARSRQPDHQAMTAARRLLRGQHRDGHVRPTLTNRGHKLPGFAGRIFKIGVQEQQMPRTRRAVPSLKLSDGLRARHHRSRLTVTAAAADDQCACFTGEMSCLIARCVVNDDHETAESGGRRHRRSYSELLISGRNDHCDVRADRVRHGPDISSARHGTEIISPRHRKAVTWPKHDGRSPRYPNGPMRDFVPALEHEQRLLVMIGLAGPSEPAPA